MAALSAHPSDPAQKGSVEAPRASRDDDPEMQLPPASPRAKFLEVLSQPAHPLFLSRAHWAAASEDLGAVDVVDLAEAACLGLSRLQPGTRRAAVAASLLAAAVFRSVGEHPGALARPGAFVTKVLSLAVRGDESARELGEGDLGGLSPAPLGVAAGLAGAASLLALGAAGVARVLQAVLTVGAPALKAEVLEALDDGAGALHRLAAALLDERLRPPPPGGAASPPFTGALLPLMLRVPEERRPATREALAPVLAERMAALAGSWSDILQAEDGARRRARWLAGVLDLFYDVSQHPPLGWLAPHPAFLPAMVGSTLSLLDGAGQARRILLEEGPELARSVMTAFLHSVELLGAAELARALANGGMLVRLILAGLRLDEEPRLRTTMAAAALAAAGAARRPVRCDDERRERDAALDELGRQVLAATLSDAGTLDKLLIARPPAQFLAQAVLLLLPCDASGKDVGLFAAAALYGLVDRGARLPGGFLALHAKELLWHSAARALECRSAVLLLAVSAVSLVRLLDELQKALDRIGAWLSLEAVPGVGAFAAALLDNVRGAPPGQAAAWEKEAVRGVGEGIAEVAGALGCSQVELWRVVCPDGTVNQAEKCMAMYAQIGPRSPETAAVAGRVSERYRPDSVQLSDLRTATLGSLLAVTHDLLCELAGKTKSAGARPHTGRVAELAAQRPAEPVARRVAHILDRAVAAGNLRCVALAWRTPPVGALAAQPLAWDAAAELLAKRDCEEAHLAGLGLLAVLLQCCAARRCRVNDQGLSCMPLVKQLTDGPEETTVWRVATKVHEGLLAAEVAAAQPKQRRSAKTADKLKSAGEEAAAALQGWPVPPTRASWWDVWAPAEQPPGTGADPPAAGPEKPAGPEAGPQCAVCLQRLSEPQVCSRCKAIRYCGAACQKLDWPAHKLDCAQLAAAAAGEA